MNDRVPYSQRDHVLVDVKAKPSRWPTASLDPDSGRGPQPTSGMPARSRIHNFRSLRFQGIAAFTSVNDLITAIQAYIDAWNDRCQPFTWTKDADTILAKATHPRNRNTDTTSVTRH